MINITHVYFYCTKKRNSKSSHKDWKGDTLMIKVNQSPIPLLNHVSKAEYL